MSLMKCKECGNSVSTKAQMCQKCGAPAPSEEDYERFLLMQKQREKEAEESIMAMKNTLKKGCLAVLIAPFLLALLGLISMWASVGDTPSKPAFGSSSRGTDSARYSSCVERCYNGWLEHILGTTGNDVGLLKQEAREVCKAECLRK